MNKKQKMWLALLCLLFWTCTDLSPFGDSEELVHDSDPALVKLAKEMLQRSKYELSLPDIHKHHSGSASTRSIKYDTDVSPLWDKARSYQHGESKTLLVPLRSADEIRSRIALRRGSDVTYQFAKAKSFLVLQQVKGYTISRVMTYLPESSYAEEHVSALDTIGYNAGAIGFHGLSIVSKIDGTFSHAFLYEHGKITRQFIRNAHLHCNHEHGEECHHESDSSTYEHTYLTIDLYTPSSLTRGGYDDGNENGNDVCPDCGKFTTDCFCIYDKFCYFCQKPNEECTCEGAVIEGERCNECGEYLQYCVCCGICGFHPCQCDDQFLCPTCKKEPCECTSGSQGGKGDGKEEGGGGNNSNSSAAPKAKDIFRNSNMTEENWQILERMLDKILDNCMGNNLYNELKRNLNGSTLSIQFNEGTGGSFFFGNGTAGISLGMQMESNQLFHEMMHAYRAYQETTATYTSSTLNGEIEAWYAQYVYVSSLPEYKGSKWEERDKIDSRRSVIKGLSKIVDEHGNLREDNTSSLLETTILSKVIPTFRGNHYNESRGYNFDLDRDGLEIFTNLRTLTENCE